MQLIRTYSLILGLTLSTTVFAYVGPGLGAGTVGVVIGILGSIILAFFAIIYYPIKRLLKKRRQLSLADDTAHHENIEEVHSKEESCSDNKCS